MKLYGGACSAGIAMISDSPTRRRPKHMAGLSLPYGVQTRNRSTDLTLMYP